MKNKSTVMISIVLAVFLMLAACGSSNSKSYNSNYYVSEDQSNSYETGYGGMRNTSSDYDYYVASQSSDFENNENISTVPEAAYKIYTANVSMQTRTFDESYALLESLVAQSGGYISSVDRSGGYTTTAGNYISPHAYIVVRIPSENFNAFLNSNGQIGEITSMNTNEQDITNSYVDTKARLEALQAQKDQLMQFLEQAKTVTEMLEIQDRLYDVIYQIESYQQRLNSYDSQIQYSTIYINLSDVSTTAVIAPSFGQRVSEAFRNSWISVANILQNGCLASFICFPISLWQRYCSS